MPNPFTLDGKVAFVTGATKGIGRAVALALAHAGASVVAAARTATDLDAVAKEIGATGGRAATVTVDVGDAAHVHSALDEAREAFGRLDIVVNNAGLPYYGRSEDMPVEAWDEVLDVNLRSMFLVAQASAPALFDAGGGSIVNIGSIDGLAGMRNMAAYCAAKAGAVGLTKALAAEWAVRGVRVNCVCPGAIATEQTAAVRQSTESGFYRHLMGHTPMGRFAEPDEVAGSVVYLASDAASFVTGAIIAVDGGYSAV